MKMLVVVLVAVSFITNCVSYGEDYREIEDYTYQRSSQPEEQGKVAPTKVNLTMPGVHPTKHDSYVCTTIALPKDKEVYIEGFIPHAEMNTAHHMLMFGCPVPAEMAFSDEKQYWNCGDMGKGICGGYGEGEKILYAWGRNAPVLDLPEDVAFEVGGKSGVSYLVLQVHYGKVEKFVDDPNLKDYSGVVLNTTPIKPSSLAAIRLLASGGQIPAKKPAWHLDNGCQYTGMAVMHPFAFRVHAHTLGRVITGYRIRDGKWTLIGKGDPQRPQAFYPIKTGENLDIHQGDSLAARCTYDSMSRDHITNIGATMKDEMCNFYMMYSFKPEENANQALSEDACRMLDEAKLIYPKDSDVPLPDDGTKMEMKRSVVEELCRPPECRRDESQSFPFLFEDNNWIGNKIDGFGRAHWPELLGQVTAVDIDSQGNVVIFHRASRKWEMDSFDDNNVFNNKYKVISDPTVLKLNPNTEQVIVRWGQDMFYMPHGLTIDHEGNTWLTDVAMHQVFKFLPGATEPSLTLGVKFEPGNDERHFCKPTDVAVDSRGTFYVSDGYCNQRIVVFSAAGSFIKQIDDSKLQKITPSVFLVPHSLSLDEKNKRLFVADRENARVLVFNPESSELVDAFTEFGGPVFAVHYHSGRNGDVLHVVTGPTSLSRPQGFTFSLNRRKVLQEWAPATGFLEPHDVTSDKNGNSVYVTDISANTVWKFNENR